MFERKGIASFKANRDTDVLGFQTPFRDTVSKVVINSVNADLWFSFCSRISENQNDIMKFKNNKGKTIGSMVSELYPNSPYKVAIYKYLLLDYLCYIETPTVKRDLSSSRGFSNTYDKFLATCNLEVVAKWLGIDSVESYNLYTKNVSHAVDDEESDLFPYLKLWVDKDGYHKLTKPRKYIDLGKPGTRVIPVFALKSGVDVLFNKSKRDYYDITFQKDGGQSRNISITFDVQKIRDIYGDCDFFRDGVESMYNGDFMNNPNLGRGYIRVFEVGGSIYDSPTRSINYARITGIRKLSKEELDLAYINVDIDSVLQSFTSGVYDSYKYLQSIVKAMRDMNISGTENLSIHSTALDLESWASGQVTLLSTTFLRELALFMLGHPQWFNGYTGKPNVISTKGNSNDDIGIDFDLDFSI